MGLETPTIAATECAAMPPSGPIVAVLEAFRSEFTEPTWTKVVLLVWGTILARGRRTVTAALRQMGLDDEIHFSKYHHVFNRAVWSPLRLACRLTCSLIRAFSPGEPRLTFVIDETLERRWGRRVRIRGHYRDPLASSKQRSVAASGIRWIVLALLVTPPWSPKPWALPVLSLPGPTPEVSARLGRRHKTIADWARQMILCLRRWLPGVDLTVVGDRAYSVIELGLCCRRRGVRLIAPLRLDARLFAPPPPRPAGTVGRPRIVGDRLPNLEVILTDPATVWEPVKLPWYDGTERVLELATGPALWYHTGLRPLPIRWVLSRDPRGELEPRGMFSTCPEDAAASILAEFIRRWPIETTFEESRAHLGIETQRQWSDLAIARETPCLFGLYALIALFGQALHQERPLTIRTAAWYPKLQATFSDVLAAVRRRCWDGLEIQTSPRDPTYAEIPRAHLDRLLNAVCYSH
jgi:DDE superfamily endonuclease